MVLVMSLVLSGLAFGARRRTRRNLTLTEGQVWRGIGWSWGKGVLTTKERVSIQGEGFPVGDVGSPRLRQGKVYNPEEKVIFNRNYTSPLPRDTGEGQVPRR